LETDEEAAKSMLDAFVYFWEKFTIDSYIFDLMTAWSAEV
jgi:pullulanase/glycogen debranching enzyme